MSRGVGLARSEESRPRTGDTRSGGCHSAAGVVGRQVVLGRIRLGLVRDVLLGADVGVVLGLVLETVAGKLCFLPWSGAQLVSGAVIVSSPSLLLGDVELDSYRSSGIPLSDLVESTVGPDPRGPVVRDLTFGGDGATVDLLLASGNSRQRWVAVGDVRVHWSAGRAPQLALDARRIRDRRPARPRMLAATARGNAA